MKKSNNAESNPNLKSCDLSIRFEIEMELAVLPFRHKNISVAIYKDLKNKPCQ